MTVVDNIHVECAFTTAPDDPAPVWTDITAWVDLRAGVATTTGRGDEYAQVQTGTCRMTLNNSDGRFTPGNTASPYYPNVKIRKKIRVWYQNPVGPGPISYRFTGYVEEWPTEWPGGNAYSSATVTATDRFKRLGSVAALRSIIEQEYLADGPTAYYTLGEPEGSTTAGDTSKNGGSALSTVQFGAGGTLTFGANTGPGTDAMPAPAFAPVNVTNGKYLTTSPAAVLVDSLTLECFVLTSAAVQQTVTRLVGAFGGWVEISTTAAGKISATDFNSTTGLPNFTLTSAASFNNGATHHVALTVAVTTDATVTLVVDGVSVGSTTYVVTAWLGPAALNVGGNAAGALFTGTISHVAVYASALSVARLLSHYQSGSTGFAGERSDQRIARLAGYAGVTAAEMSLEVGSSTSITHVDTTGMAPLAAMQDVAATEGGVLFMDGQGLLTFHARSHRYNAASAMTIAATDADSSLRFIANDSLLVNDVTAGRAAGATVRAVNAASVADYGTTAVSLTLLTTSDLEVADAANWKANASSAVNPRPPNLTVDLLTSPTLTASALLLGLGSRITLSGLPAQAPASSVDSFIEGWTETISSTSWALAWNASPAADSGVWQLDSATYSILGTSSRLAY